MNSSSPVIAEQPQRHPGIENFWWLQSLFWMGLCVATFLSLTLWYGNATWQHLAHTLLQGLAGMILSYPLHIVFALIWNQATAARVFISLIAVALACSLWNVFRMIAYIQLTGEVDIWDDFGGWYFGAFFVFLCWTALYHGICYQQLLRSENLMMIEAEAQISKEKLKRVHAESEAKEAQLKMLRYQLNPHFLFNTLNAINSLVGTDDPARAQEMIVKLSQFMRYSLDNNPEARIPLQREIDALMLYLDIEKTRFGDRLTIDFAPDPDTLKALVPSLLLQPLIENSMKYAIAQNQQGGTIKLRSHRYEEILVLELSDSGSGAKMQSSKIKSQGGRGIGLRNTVDRLKAFYGKDYTFNFVAGKMGGLKTVIELPFETIEQRLPDNQNEPA